MIIAMILLFGMYTCWVYIKGTEIAPNKVLSNEAVQGKLLWQKYNCTSCHQLYGLGGYMGPDLTNELSTIGKGREYAGIFLKAGTARMPNLHLSDSEISCLMDFLTYIDKSGTYPVYHEKITQYGNIDLDK